MSKRGKARKRRAANVNDATVAPTNTNRQQNHNANADISANSDDSTHKVAAASSGRDSDRDETRVFTPKRKSPRLSKLSLSKNRRAKRDRDWNRTRLMHDKESQNPEVPEERNNTGMSQNKSPQNEGKTTTKRSVTKCAASAHNDEVGKKSTNSSPSKKRPRITYSINDSSDSENDLGTGNGADTDDMGYLTQGTPEKMEMDQSNDQWLDAQISTQDHQQNPPQSQASVSQTKISQPQKDATLNSPLKSFLFPFLSPWRKGARAVTAATDSKLSSGGKKSRARGDEMDFVTPIRSGTHKLPFDIPVPTFNLLSAQKKEAAEEDGNDENGSDSDRDNDHVEEGDDNDEDNDESPEKEQNDYYQKVVANRKRNDQRLFDLGFVNAHTKKAKGISDDKQNGDHEDENESMNSSEFDREPTGMLFATRNNGFQTRKVEQLTLNGSIIETDGENVDKNKEKANNQSLFEMFPHREKEITLLESFLQSAVRQTQITNEYRDDYYDSTGLLEAYVPAPIFVTGPSGSGKTSVVRAVLQKVQRDAHLSNKMSRSKATLNDGMEKVAKKNESVYAGVAYVDCSTIEIYGSGAGAILESAYSQLAKTFYPEKESRDSSGKPASNKISGMVGGSIASTDCDSFTSGSDSFDFGTDEDSLTDSSVDTNSFIGEIHDGDFDENGGDNDGQSLEDDEEDLMEKTAAQERGVYRKGVRASSKPINPRRATRSTSEKEVDAKEAPRRSSRLNIGNYMGSKVSSKRRTSNKRGPSMMGMLSTPAVFGRYISDFCGVSGFKSFRRGCAFLVLDQASNLLSFSNSRHKDVVRTNFLSELLLLPKVMKLNLTIVVITDKLFLEQTRINNIDQPMNTLGTLETAFAPIRCHFAAYNMNMVREIVATSHLKSLSAGISHKISADLPATIINQLYKSLVDIVIQSIESTSRDIREVLKFTRMLWPIYIEPLGKFETVDFIHKQVDGSVNSKHAILSRDILEKLGRSLRPHIRSALQNCLFRPGGSISSKITNGQEGMETQEERLPYLAKFMLLAAYLCQANKADQDRLLYTNARSGQRRNNRRGDKSHSESLTHATSQQALQQLRSEKIASFPLERMLSVFSSICNKYANRTSKVAQKELFYHPSNETIYIEKLGSYSSMRFILELRQYGFLQDASVVADRLNSMDTSGVAYSKSITSTKFTCNLSKERAQIIAQSLGFPLKDYLTEHK